MSHLRREVESLLARRHDPVPGGGWRVMTAELQALRAALDADYPPARPGIAAQRVVHDWSEITGRTG